VGERECECARARQGLSRGATKGAKVLRLKLN
jgi:hypothetical protein